MADWQWVDGGVCAAEGFHAGSASCGIKERGPDVGLVASDRPCSAAGMFTTNSLPGWPVVLSREILASGAPVSGVVANSGVSNVATGEAGLAVARAMVALAARGLSAWRAAASGAVLLAQTGVIGDVPPLEKLAPGVAEAAAGLSREGGDGFAKAIMTTDTRPKSRALACELDSGRFSIGGSAKGAGMIAPRMATMLAFLTTDARATSESLGKALRHAVEPTFNRITIDGDTSTSDSVFLLANGASGVDIDADPAAYEAFAHALRALCEELAKELVRDAEGVTRVARVTVRGAVSDEDALLAARAIAESPLVKTALFGADPNWGRIWMAVGKSGAQADPAKLSITVGATPVLVSGAPTPGGKAQAAEEMRASEVEIDVDLGLGAGAAHYWFSDFTYDYVKINAEYHT